MGSGFLDAQHLLDHLKVLGHCVPGHLSPLGDSAVIRFVGAKPHVLPDLPLLLGEFLRRWDPSQPVQDCLPLGVQLLDEHLQFLLTLLPGVGVDAFRVLGAVRPGGRVASLEEVIVDLGDAAGSRLAGTPHDWLEVGEWILRRLRRVLRYLIAQAPIDFGGGFAEHIASDVCVDVQRCRRRHMAQHGGECLDVHAVLQRHGGKGMVPVPLFRFLAMDSTPFPTNLPGSRPPHHWQLSAYPASHGCRYQA